MEIANPGLIKTFKPVASFESTNARAASSPSANANVVLEGSESQSSHFKTYGASELTRFFAREMPPILTFTFVASPANANFL
jgi:hypothetical protein